MIIAATPKTYSTFGKPESLAANKHTINTLIRFDMPTTAKSILLRNFDSGSKPKTHPRIQAVVLNIKICSNLGSTLSNCCFD
jgi:hypothetical protein